MNPACIIDFNLNDSSQSITALLVRIQPVLSALDNEINDIPAINLEACGYIGPDAVAILASLVHQAKDSNRTLKLILPDEPPELVAFCAYAGLTTLITGSPLPDPNHPRCETIPLTLIGEHPYAHVERLVTLVRRHLPDLREDNAEYLRIAFGEVIQNVTDHAHSPFGAVVSARYFSGTRQIRVAIVDRGRGIPTTLRTRFPDLKRDSQTLDAVLEGQHSSKSRESNMGLGIHNLAQFTRLLGGDLVLVSGNAWAHTGSGIVSRSHDVNKWTFAGTGVFFMLRLDVVPS